MKIAKGVTFTDDKHSEITEPIQDRDVKLRTTIFIDADIIKELKAQAKENNEDYQTLFNHTLRQAVFGELK